MRNKGTLLIQINFIRDGNKNYYSSRYTIAQKVFSQLDEWKRKPWKLHLLFKAIANARAEQMLSEGWVGNFQLNATETELKLLSDEIETKKIDGNLFIKEKK